MVHHHEGHGESVEADPGQRQQQEGHAQTLDEDGAERRRHDLAQRR